MKVSEEGAVLNTKTGNRIGSNKSGYWRISARDGVGRSWSIAVHRLVWLAHNGKIPRNRVINHKDGNKLNCSLENLEIETFSGNTKHAYEMGLATISHAQKRKVALRTCKLTMEQAVLIRSLKKDSNTTYTALAKDFGVSRATIKRVVEGLTYTGEFHT